MDARNERECSCAEAGQLAELQSDNERLRRALQQALERLKAATLDLAHAELTIARVLDPGE